MAFKKAVIAGVTGAVAWEVAARILRSAGLAVFDIVRVLGTMVFGTEAHAVQWWPIGLAFHCSVGTVWAIFYAHFFWSSFDFKPWLQGTLFSLLPAFLAGTVMVPQIDVMTSDQHSALGPFAIALGFWGPAMMVLGHLIFGFVMGSIYVRPVGYRVGTRIQLHV